MPRKKNISNYVEKRMVDGLDKLAMVESLLEDLGPNLIEDVRSGLSAEEIYKKYETLAAARAVSIVVREKDTGKALAAVKEILDRSKGKSTEKREVEHKFAHLPDKELDAILATEFADIEELESGEGGDEA